VALVPAIASACSPGDVPQFRITVETPDGASLADTDRALRFVEDELARHPEVKHWFANLGRQPRIYYNIFPKRRTRTSPRWRRAAPFRPAAQPACTRSCARTWPSTPGAHHRRVLPERPADQRPIEVAISGPDLDQLRTLARARGHHRGDAWHARRGQRRAPPAHRPRLRIDSQKAALLGVAPVDIDRTVRRRSPA